MIPNITLKSLMSSEIMKSADIFSTPEGMSNNLKSVNIMDISDIEKWLSGNELLIIGKFMTSHFTKTFIEGLKHKNVGAILSKKKYRQYITDDMIDLLRYYHIPLILIDNKYSWGDVTIAFQEAEITQSTKALKESEHFIKDIIQYFSDNHSLNNLCQIVFENTNLSIAIVTKELDLIDYSTDWSWDDYFERFSSSNIGRFYSIGVNLNNKSVDGFCFRSIFLQNLGFNLFFLPIYDQNQLVYYLVYKTDHKTNQIEATVLSKLENIASIFKLKQVLELEFQKNNHYFKSIIFDDLLKIDTPNDNLLKRYSLSLGKQIDQELQILVISDLLIESDLLKFEEAFFRFLTELSNSSFNNTGIHIFSKEQSIVVVMGAHTIVNSRLKDLQEFTKDFIGHRQFFMGISTVKPYWKLKTALDEAKQAVRFAKSNQKPNYLQFYQDIGILKLLTDDYGNINQLFVSELFDQFLNPILSYDATNNTQLYETLSTFFDNHFSYIESSRILFIHVNTLRTRLNKVEELLTISLKNTDHLMNLHLALRLYQNDLLDK